MNASCLFLHFIITFTLHYSAKYVEIGIKSSDCHMKGAYLGQEVDSGTYHGSEYGSMSLGFCCLYPFPPLP